MLQTKFQGYQSSGSREEKILKVFSIYGSLLKAMESVYAIRFQ